MKKPLILFSSLFYLATSFSVFAYMAPPELNQKQAKKMFSEVDKNKDKKISFEELYDYQQAKQRKRQEKEVARIMQSCDKNHDGKISANEMVSMKQRFQPQNEINSSPDQVPQRPCRFPKEALEFLDANNDGEVTKDEMVSVILEGRRPSRKLEKKRELAMQKEENKRKRKDFTTCDANQDTLLSLREAASMKCNLHMFTEKFDAHDIDHDNYLSLEELMLDKTVEYRPGNLPPEEELRKKMPPLDRLEFSMRECDKDDDGRLGKQETIGKKCEQDLVYFDSIDHNQDGYIGQKEIQRARAKQDFERMDKDNSGFLEGKELDVNRVGYW